MVGSILTIASHLPAAASTKYHRYSTIRDYERRSGSENLVPTPSTYGSGEREREKRTIGDLDNILPTINLPTIDAGNIPIIGDLLNKVNITFSRSDGSDEEDGLNMPEDTVDLLVREGEEDSEVTAF